MRGGSRRFGLRKRLFRSQWIGESRRADQPRGWSAATGKRLPLIHPGEILRDDFLQPMKISVYALAQAIKVPRSRVNDIALGRRGIAADTAFRLARYFGTTPDFWINLQARHDLEAANRKLRRRIEREVRPRAA